MRKLSYHIVIGLIFSTGVTYSQLSPGVLSTPHSHLEGISNCTQCHVLGNRVSGEKCLACHTEIKTRIESKKGYHASSEVNGKECFACHSEHNGKNFQLVRLDQGKFNHALTGYSLSLPHAAKECRDCHNQKFISDRTLKNRKNTYLGLSTDCLSCHEDYHQQTLSRNCLECHSPETFKPAAKFNHSNARFQLVGKHKSVDCIKCHKKQVINGREFQEFRGVSHANCTSCHKDPHQNQFGQNCRQCHNEESFHSVSRGTVKFDHDKTGFKLEGRHQNVTCNQCHKTKFTDPLKHDRCTDCHKDYHNGQFINNGVPRDCKECHSVNGFTQFSYTVTQHNSGKFPLKGSHVAVPCFECHKKQEKWSFRGIGLNCADCHADIHKNFIPVRYYPGSDCRSCHNEKRWTEVGFDHSKTAFSLTGAHVSQSCRSCHFRPDKSGLITQKFSGIPNNCTSCHTDNHYGQFMKNGVTSCTDCHGTENWKASLFDHKKTAFPLDGKHINVPCAKCHKPQQEGSVTYTRYKIKDFRCESCHL